ncbi:hypothetical protein PAAG_02911 [Paracoccidioides lutzii Pb01]|uniref:Uncharacterized protein n=1 Tax=Paracoccidioides lutzii (strain ATCC MYA-826 / Pb01) TaxID=502779 RepID=C1GWL6_PARBA|nr:hypothetical protein PAAG_02911 [Paracoccidioides lutzii Pb01]EEH40935.2 hypothetical protein PAAG_02911 [Paracoccidioides lutzii Pb01]
MFMPGPPQLSEAEVKAGEKEAAQTIKAVITGSILLYLYNKADVESSSLSSVSDRFR